MDKQFLEIYHLYKNDIYRLAFSYSKNYADADDVTQTVFIKFYNNFHQFNDEEHIKKWLIKVTINECKTLLLSAWKRKILLLNEKENDLFIVEKTKDNLVLDAILNLPKKYRIVTHLYYYEEYKISEISKILNIKETTIQTQLLRARNMLKEMLKGDFEDE